MRCFYFVVAICASMGLAARIKKTVTQVSKDEAVDYDNLTLREGDEEQDQDYAVLDEDYEPLDKEDSADGTALLEEGVDEDDEAMAESGAPGCCTRNCCVGKPSKRDKCIRQLNMCHRTGGGSFNGGFNGGGFHRPGNQFGAPGCCTRDCCVGKPNKRDRCISQLNMCHRNGGSFNGGFHGGGFHGGGVFKKHEICCMCQRQSFGGRMEWFPGEDYTVGEGNANAKCNRECAYECQKKGAMFAGCWAEQRMKQLRRDARNNPMWTIRGMPDDWFGDNPRDIC